MLGDDERLKGPKYKGVVQERLCVVTRGTGRCPGLGTRSRFCVGALKLISLALLSNIYKPVDQ
jgi:hypothetical protein